MHVRWRADAGVELTVPVPAVLESVYIIAERHRSEFFCYRCLRRLTPEWSDWSLEFVVWTVWTLRSRVMLPRRVSFGCAAVG